jgi:hypothetical protein
MAVDDRAAGILPPDISAVFDEALASVPIAVWRHETPWRRGAPGKAWRWHRGVMLSVSETVMICVDGGQLHGWVASLNGVTLAGLDRGILFDTEGEACDLADTAARSGDPADEYGAE